MKFASTIFCAGVVLAFQGSFAGAHAASTSGHCTGMTVTDYISSNVVDLTHSTAWQNITDAHLNFTTSATGCVVITFAGLAGVEPDGMTGDEFLSVRTLLDGTILCVQGGTDDTFLQSGTSSTNVAASITHACKNVAAGTHTMQVQYHALNGGVGDALIKGHVLTVTHN